jgi:hypothetical protein
MSPEDRQIRFEAFYTYVEKIKRLTGIPSGNALAKLVTEYERDNGLLVKEMAASSINERTRIGKAYRNGNISEKDREASPPGWEVISRIERATGVEAPPTLTPDVNEALTIDENDGMYPPNKLPSVDVRMSEEERMAVRILAEVSADRRIELFREAARLHDTLSRTRKSVVNP